MPEVNFVDPRRKARMLTLQCLFGMDLRDWSQEIPLEWLIEDDPIPTGTKEFAQGLIQGVQEGLAQLDSVIHKYAPAWPIDQLSVVDRNVLRIALFELMFRKDTPRKSAVNEAVELAKAFGSESSSRFVNGVLGSIMLDLESGELVVDQPVYEGS
ncbi:MAG: transcription antitermination factor NusB [Chloroflexi bacterium]|nr:transcription antitermination factor NusB [Chloroflexota bacterium]MDA1218585.1 transcription antitermination factor NusB [Chloroflexota bacterium]PKB58014.1 MAG: transcription antitermination factor NusB [SAR202 cluster bacterium Casp-Chloro-G3]